MSVEVSPLVAEHPPTKKARCMTLPRGVGPRDILAAKKAKADAEAAVAAAMVIMNEIPDTASHPEKPPPAPRDHTDTPSRLTRTSARLEAQKSQQPVLGETSKVRKALKRMRRVEELGQAARKRQEEDIRNGRHRRLFNVQPYHVGGDGLFLTEEEVERYKTFMSGGSNHDVFSYYQSNPETFVEKTSTKKKRAAGQAARGKKTDAKKKKPAKRTRKSAKTDPPPPIDSEKVTEKSWKEIQDERDALEGHGEEEEFISEDEDSDE
jgi:hypothetical protein